MSNQTKLGDLLLARKIITQEQLQEALQRQKQTGEKIGQALLSLNFINEQQFLEAFSEQLNIPFYNLKEYNHIPEVAQQLPESYARLYKALILKKTDDHYLIGMANPLDLVATDRLSKLLHKPLKFALVKEQDLPKVFNIIYRRTKDISSFAQELSVVINQDRIKPAELVSEVSKNEPIIKLIDSLFEDAAQVNASDIHIEPNKHDIRIRLRIDGILHEQVIAEASIMPAIVSRLKLISGLNISEKRMPQDGRFGIEVASQRFDVRLSTMPTLFGESIVLRMLPQNQNIHGLEQSGMRGNILERMRKLIHRPNGVILVTGPTGSGKSTTLYAAINEINDSQIKIITVEDPIEYFLPWAVQIQANEQIGLSFSTVLRGILRHDPDVILLGEMRDKETSSIAMRTALTGRLVLSTLHTNDATSAIYRLIDLGIDGYIIAATTQAILAQRLVRMICPQCIENHTLTEHERVWLSKLTLPIDGIEFKQGKGCSFCSQMGYRGRTGIFELLEFNGPMAEALRTNNQQLFHQLAQQSLQGKLLLNNAYDLACQGMTTVSEILRVINEGYALQDSL